MALMCQGEVLFEPMEAAWLIDFHRYFDAELQQLAPMQEQGLVRLTPDGVEVTEMGWFFVRGVAMVFDKYLQAGMNRAKFSRII
jgi:oxygen-independent coproporphyrinogen-3 oxidase